MTSDDAVLHIQQWFDSDQRIALPARRAWKVVVGELDRLRLERLALKTQLAAVTALQQSSEAVVQQVILALDTERLRLVACGTAAREHQPGSVRLSPRHPHYSESYRDVCDYIKQCHLDIEQRHRDIERAKAEMEDMERVYRDDLAQRDRAMSDAADRENAYREDLERAKAEMALCGRHVLVVAHEPRAPAGGSRPAAAADVVRTIDDAEPSAGTG